MRKTISLALFLTLGLTACGGDSKKEPTTTTTTSAAVQLTIGEMKLIDVNKNKAVLIKADGTIELEGKAMAKVTPDGKIVKIDTGEVGLELLADGSIKSVKDGKDIGMKIDAEGVMTAGDKTISFAASGELIGGNPDAPKMKVEGATDAGLKRTAMFVLAAFSVVDEAKTEVGASTSETVPAPEIKE